jgi:excinuclease ABC subunit C
MQTLAQQQCYEEAAVLRDQVRDLRMIQERQYVDGEKGDVDVLALVESAGIICVHLMMFRQGRLLGTGNHFPKYILETTPSSKLQAFIGQYYLGSGSQFSLPRELVCNIEPDESESLQQALSEVAGRKVIIASSVKTHRQKWLDLALTNAAQGLQDKLNSRQSVERRFAVLAEVLQLAQTPARLECFDISHSSGEATVASCVVFDTSGPLKSDYRRFNIDGITPGDDYAAMKQALTRRFTRLLKGEAKLPDLLVIDGGLGQLKQAEEVLAELGVSNVLLMGIAKGISRRAGQETLILGHSHLELALPVESPALHLLQHIRDEAHRFAITAHRNRRSKARNQSSLEAIPGIGPKKRKELLQHFGGRQEILRASIDELERVTGISHQMAETIYEHLHGA